MQNVGLTLVDKEWLANEVRFYVRDLVKRLYML